MKTTKEMRFWLRLFVAVVVALSSTARSAWANDEDIITRGTITAMDATTITVDAVVYTVNGSTEYQDNVGNPLTKSDFTVGDTVKAKGQFSGDTLVAEEIKNMEQKMMIAKLKSKASSPQKLFLQLRYKALSLLLMVQPQSSTTKTKPWIWLISL